MPYHTINKSSLPSVIAKAKQYRSLLEPDLAISICLDVFAVDQNNQEALVIYILSLTDLYSHDVKVDQEKILSAINRLNSDFERNYYIGLMHERKARSYLNKHMSRSFAFEGLQNAMEYYELAEKLQPEDICDANLRYNSCLRTIEKEKLTPRQEFNELY